MYSRRRLCPVLCIAPWNVSRGNEGEGESRFKQRGSSTSERAQVRAHCGYIIDQEVSVRTVSISTPFIIASIMMGYYKRYVWPPVFTSVTSGATQLKGGRARLVAFRRHRGPARCCLLASLFCFLLSMSLRRLLHEVSAPSALR